MNVYVFVHTQKVFIIHLNKYNPDMIEDHDS
jgi:hypothetical protein